MRQPAPDRYRISNANNKDIIHDLRAIYGSRLERLDHQAQRHLLILAVLATEFDWVSAQSEFFIGHRVPAGALALAQNLDKKGAFTLACALICNLRCGDPLIPPKLTYWQRLVAWVRSFPMPE